MHVLQFEFQKFRILEILNFHPCCLFQYKATDFVVPGAGKLDIKFTPDDGSDPMQYTVFQFENSGGVALAMYNTDEVLNHTV